MKRVAWIIGSTLSILGAVGIIAPIVVNTVTTKTIAQPPKQYIKFDGLLFEDEKARDEYIYNNTTLKTQRIEQPHKYFRLINGDRYEINKNQMDEIINPPFNKKSYSQINLTSDSSYRYASNEFGYVDPKYHDEIQCRSGKFKNIAFYKGNANKTYWTQEEAILSLLNAGHKVYKFNNIYFDTKDDLFDYLVNHYFSYSTLEPKPKQFRIKSASGAMSDIIDFDDKAWSGIVSAFIYNNCEKVIKIRISNSTYRFIRSNSIDDVRKNININDVPYLNIKSNDGKKSWIMGLNLSDKYHWGGHIFYYGHEDMSNIINKSLWQRRDGKALVNIEDVKHKCAWWILNSFFDLFISPGEIDVGTNTTHDLGNEYKYSKGIETILFRENIPSLANLNPMMHNHEITVHEQTNRMKQILNESFGPFFSEKEIDIGSVKYKMSEFLEPIVDTAIDCPLYKASLTLRNIFITKKKLWIYNDTVNMLNIYRTNKEFNSLLRIPLAYNYMIDKCINAGADQELIETITQYFRSVANYFNDIILNTLGEYALKPSSKNKLDCKLDFSKIFGLTPDDNKTQVFNITNTVIDFNIEKYLNYFPERYPNLFVSAFAIANIDKIHSIGLTMPIVDAIKIATIGIQKVLPSSYKMKQHDIISDVKKCLEFYYYKRLSQINDYNFIIQCTNDEMKLGSYLSYVAYALNTTNRDSIVDNMLSELSELQSANDNWDFVPSDNRLTKLALFVQETHGIKIKPSDFINIVDLWNPDTLLGLNNACNQIDLIISNVKTSNNKQLEKISRAIKIFYDVPDYTKEEILLLDKLEASYGQRLVTHILKMSQDVVKKNKLIYNKILMIPFSGAVLSFNEYFIITTMRMLRRSCSIWNIIPIW